MSVKQLTVSEAALSSPPDFGADSREIGEYVRASLEVSGVYRELEDLRVGERKSQLTGSDKRIASETVNVVTARVVGMVVTIYERAAQRASQTHVAAISAVSAGLSTWGAVKTFMGEELFPSRGIRRPGERADGEASKWEKFNKRGYLVFATLLISALVAVWFTKETASWKSACEAARAERDVLRDAQTRMEGQIKDLKAEVAGLNTKISELTSQNNALTLDLRDAQSAAAGSVDAKAVQKKLDDKIADYGKQATQLATAQGEVNTQKALLKLTTDQLSEAKEQIEKLSKANDKLQIDLGKALASKK